MTNGILLTRHNQEIAQWSPDPFPHKRVGSGHETYSDHDITHLEARFSGCEAAVRILKTTPSLGPFSHMYACGATSLLIEGLL